LLGEVRSVTNAGKNAKKKAAQTGEQLDTSRAVSGQMGSKWIIPYGLYMVKGYVSPSHADRCGFSEEDLQTLWNSILTMFDNDRSAARPNMATRELFIFKHDSYLGNASPARTVDMIKVVKNPGVSVPRSFDDYTVTVPNPPQFIKVIRMTPDEFAYPK
jgi:CRISPR-associated protein Csd2